MAGGDWKEMFRAIQFGDLELVRYYLRMGIDPNYQHPEFLVSPLVESIRYDQLEIAKMLLDHGADPKIVEINGKDTPMKVAKSLKNKQAIELLNSYLK